MSVMREDLWAAGSRFLPSGFYMVCGLTVVLAGWWTWKFYQKRVHRTRLAGLIRERLIANESIQNDIQNRLNAIRAQDEPNWDRIRTLDFQVLIQELRDGSLRAKTVIHAYQDAAIKTHQETNCVVRFIAEAEAWAEARDTLHPEERGPLHGIPISVKECYFIKGYESTAGLTWLLGHPSEENALIVDQMISLGAVPFCMTNVPQSNPHNTERECGGSSGGEAALIAGGGSILGLGNDIGGSLRNPAALCGCYSLKPTYGRHLSQINSRMPTPYNCIWPKSVGGFLAKDLATLKTAWKCTWANLKTINESGWTGPEDNDIISIPWREDLCSQGRPLLIGYYLDDGFLLPHPGCSRVVEETVILLKSQGHTLIEIQPPDIETTIRLYSGLIFADNGAGLKESLDADLWDSSMVATRAFLLFSRLPSFVQKICSAVVSRFTKVKITAPFITGKSLLKAMDEKDQLRNDYLAYLARLGVHAILTPGAIMPAPPKGTQGEFPFGIYAYIPWNLFNFCAGIVPMGEVSKTDQSLVRELPNTDLFYDYLRRFSDGSVGLPLSVQVVARNFEEEIVFRIMEDIVEAKVKKDKNT
eukprot:TCALIF_04823-PA protein Name:"Similar to faah-1 Fatty acid amide hydrolase 1 (Caenorhabditis elegans)" AED:0.06 eAED:0.06 QI:0/0.83/0.69/0.92/0.83/0.84/13/66/586